MVTVKSMVSQQQFEIVKHSLKNLHKVINYSQCKHGSLQSMVCLELDYGQYQRYCIAP